LGIGNYVATASPNSNANTFVAQRTPFVFKTVQASASGSTAAWTPTSGKKFRLMRFKLVIPANSTVTSGGVVTIKFLDAAADLNVSHDVFIPGTAGTALGAYDSGWIDLGNGQLSAAANNVLNVNLSSALATGAVRVIVCGTEE
jgi:hypothetical protein